MEDRVSVRWWNHRHALYRAIRSLQNQETFADIILICENKRFEAHKFVLSACSEFFEKELGDIPYKECFYLPAEIKEQYFLPLLDYMYGGEAIVKEEDVNPLLKAAEVLCVRGLAVPFYCDEDEDEDNDEESSSEATEPKNNQRALISRPGKETVKRKRKLNETQTVISTVPSNSQRQDLAFCSVPCDSNITLNPGPTASGQKYVQCIDETVIDKSQSNMDVNDMLTVLINGEQNVSGQKRKNWTQGQAGEEKAKDPKLVCPHCQRQFHWRSNLTKHIRIHTGEKPYTCPACDYKTGYSEALKRHIRTHTGEKPYECGLCDYKCKDGSSLKLHMNRHTGESSFSCDFCTYKTRIRTAYVKHMSTHNLQAEMTEIKQEGVLEPLRPPPPPEVPSVNLGEFPYETGFLSRSLPTYSETSSKYPEPNADSVSQEIHSLSSTT